MEWNIHKKHEKFKHAVKSSSSSTKHSSILRHSLRQYIEPQIDITFSLLCFIFGTYAAPLPSSSLWTYAALLPSSPFLSLLSFLFNLLPEPMHVCKTAPVWTSQRLAIWSTFWFHTTFCFVYFGTYAAPLPSSSLWTYAAPLPSSPFLSLSFFCCMSKLSIQVLSMVRIVKSYSWLRPPCSNPKHSNSNCKSQVPDSLSCFSLWDTRQRTNYTTALLLSQDTLQSSNAANLVELHASLLVVQDVQSTWPKVRKGNPPGSINITSILFANSTGNHHSKTIKLISQQNHLADISMLIHPSREVRYGCSKPKGEYLHSNYLHTKSSQSDNNSRVPTCLRVPYTFSASVPVLTTTSVHVSQDNCNNPSRESHTWSVCDTKQLLKFRSKKKYENKLTAKFPVSFQVQVKTVSTSYTVQVVSIDLQYYMLNSNTSTTAVQTKDATWCIWEIKINIPKQTVPTCHLFLSPLSTNSLNTKFHCAFSAMTVPIYLSLSTPVPILPGKQQCFRLQSQGHQSVQTSVKPHCSCTLPNLRCSTTHVLPHKCGK